MKNKVEIYSSSLGFTIVEMLATIAIIAILIGLLLPAFNMVREAADTLKQKSQFNSIEIALESFRDDHGDYPESLWDVAFNRDNNCGAQSLAEAMLGQDGFGFHPDSEFRQDGKSAVDGYANYLYTAATTGDRFGLYLELETANAVKLSSIYPNPPGTRLVDDIRDYTYVLADSFGLVTHQLTRKKTGMPILYFKANTSKTEHITPDPLIEAGDDANIYSYIDNYYIFDKLNSSVPWDTSQSHKMTPAKFYNATTNPNFPAPNARPYNPDSFILLSAGADGLYGTSDDVYNFEND